MKRGIVPAVLFSLLILSSCKFLNKSGNKELEALSLQKLELEQRLRNDSANYARELASLRTEYEQKLAAFEAANQRQAKGFFVVVGSFKDPKLAENFAAKVQSMGHEGKVIDGPSLFNCVTYGTFTSLRESLPALQNARSIADDAWIMIR